MEGWESSSSGDWNPHWIRVAEEDEAMKIGPWVASPEEEGILGGQIRGGGCKLPQCNASIMMISRSQHITD